MNRLKSAKNNNFFEIYYELLRKFKSVNNKYLEKTILNLFYILRQNIICSTNFLFCVHKIVHRRPVIGYINKMFTSSYRLMLSITIFSFCVNITNFKIVRPVLQNNSYFAHPESIILSGITDEDEYNNKFRKFACEKLIETRMNLPTNFIRVFDKSVIKLNFWALSYIDMIDCSNHTATIIIKYFLYETVKGRFL